MEQKNSHIKRIIVANWKMNPTTGEIARAWFTEIQKQAHNLHHVEIVVCPPLVYLESLGEMVTDRSCVLGAQDAFWEHEGAYTGHVSADMIFNTKARYVIVGHSERRAMGETDTIINKKITSILQFPLIPIVCLGETSRDDDNYGLVIKQQLYNACNGLSRDQIVRIVIAYEPVWAIGKNALRACTSQECAEAISMIRQALADVLASSDLAKQIPILYGGSVSPDNAEEFLSQGKSNGLLVGRASLDPKSFITITKIAEKLV